MPSSPFRSIQGVGTIYTKLLLKSDVDTVESLAFQNPEMLAARMAERNSDFRIARKLPGSDRIRQWVTEAHVLSLYGNPGRDEEP